MDAPVSKHMAKSRQLKPGSLFQANPQRHFKTVPDPFACVQVLRLQQGEVRAQCSALKDRDLSF